MISGSSRGFQGLPWNLLLVYFQTDSSHSHVASSQLFAGALASYYNCTGSGWSCFGRTNFHKHFSIKWAWLHMMGVVWLHMVGVGLKKHMLQSNFNFSDSECGEVWELTDSHFLNKVTPTSWAKQSLKKNSRSTTAWWVLSIHILLISPVLRCNIIHLVNCP